MEEEKKIIESAMAMQIVMMHQLHGKGQVYPLKNLTSSFVPGMACQGTQISDMDMSFGPGTVYLSAFYQEVDPKSQDAKFCARYKEFMDVYHDMLTEAFSVVEDLPSFTNFLSNSNNVIKWLKLMGKVLYTAVEEQVAPKSQQAVPSRMIIEDL